MPGDEAEGHSRNIHSVDWGGRAGATAPHARKPVVCVAPDPTAAQLLDTPQAGW